MEYTLLYNKQTCLEQNIPPVPNQLLSGDEIDQDRVVPEEDNKTGVGFASVLVMKSVVGVSVLGLPRTMETFGYVTTFLLIWSCGIITGYTCQLLMKSKNLSRHSNYSSISEYISGSTIIKITIYFLIIINNFGICTAELLVFGQNTRVLVNYYDFYGDRWFTQVWFICIIISIIIVPMLLYRKIQKLKIYSLLGIMAIVFFAICLFINFIERMIINNWQFPDGFKPFNQNFNVFQAFATLPNILLAYLFQMNFFPIYKSIKESNDEKMRQSSWIGIISCALLYSIISFLGYATYGQAITTTNFITSIPHNQISSILFTLLTLTFIINVCFSLPVMFFAARNNFISIIKTIFNIQSDIFLICTISLYALILFLAILIGDLGPIFNVIGALASNSIGFIIPSIFYISLSVIKHNSFKIHLLLSSLIITLAIPLGIFSVVSQIIS